MRPHLVGHVFAIAVFSYGLAGCAAKTANPQAITDALTSARIRTALVNDPQLGARAIEVRVTAGVAHVNVTDGFTEEEAERLQRIVRAVAGVTEVEATVEIAAPRDPAPGQAEFVRAKRPPGQRR